MLIEIPEVLSKQEVHDVRVGLAQLPFNDGRLTAGALAESVKNNLEVQPCRAWEPLARTVMNALMSNDSFIRFALPRKLMNPLFNRYDVGMEYGSHTDIAIMDAARPEFATRTDISLTLFLSDPDSYEGGELVISSSVGESRFKSPAGTAVVYPSGNLHWVEPVREGSRLAAVSWVQSYVNCPIRRGILFELDNATDLVRENSSGREEVDLMVSVYHNLIRMWSQT